MQLLTLLISLGFFHLWDGTNPLQRDGWYWRWLNFLGSERAPQLAHKPEIRLVAGVLAPVLLLLIIMALLAAISYWLLLPASVIILLYSFGRSSMSGTVDAYTSACACNNWQFGIEQASTLGVDGNHLNEGDWNDLHQKVLEAAAYRGYERMFAVVFWFLILGPAGALFYRLSSLYRLKATTLNRAERDSALAERLVWILEWPSVRLTGISFAITGNFVGCFRRWQQCVVCTTRSSGRVLYEAVVGALLMDDNLLSNPEITRRELSALHGLYRRTFWLWLACIGIWGILL